MRCLFLLAFVPLFALGGECEGVLRTRDPLPFLNHYELWHMRAQLQEKNPESVAVLWDGEKRPRSLILVGVNDGERESLQRAVRETVAEVSGRARRYKPILSLGSFTAMIFLSRFKSLEPLVSGYLKMLPLIVAMDAYFWVRVSLLRRRVIRAYGPELELTPLAGSLPLFSRDDTAPHSHLLLVPKAELNHWTTFYAERYHLKVMP